MKLRKYIVTMMDDGSRQSEEYIRELECYWGADEIETCEDAISREEVRRVLGNEVFELMKIHTTNPEDNPKADAMAHGVNWSLNTLMELPPVTPKVKSEDAISRTEAIDALHQSINLLEAKERIEELPPVKPQTKIGHWIWQTEDIYKCSECGEDIHVNEVMNKPQYVCCPMCGVKMEVVE